ncbi:Type II protein arginine methyltransferase [Durusdinium trenchii]|uniref:Protein arginine methyltransferase NDUFAF7 n=1 Tax=Durusdinium trenchii TaxID=1381693 RepID=A0ABP0R084_9DINO
MASVFWLFCLVSSETPPSEGAKADVSALAAEAAESAKALPKKRRRVDLAPYDISNELCWVDQSKGRCCQGDATTHSDCWDESYSFEECCPNADCFDGEVFTYEACCAQVYGLRGNEGCWSGYYDYEHCCLANRSSQSWVDILLREIDTDQFYGMDEFYTDAQYGNDFGYYSTGRVLGKSDGKSAQEFAHYTTYPMALSPHFGRVLCRVVFIMWLQMNEKAPFRVVEIGAGSGQLAHDIQECVKRNELGIDPPVWRRFLGAFEYVIVERSPALSRRQRQRGLRVVNADAQRKDSCPVVLEALTQSDACSAGQRQPARRAAAECEVTERGNQHTAASLVLSNELLDAFAPVKLQLSIYGQPVVTHCRAWQEIRLVHIINLDDLRAISEALEHSEQRITAMALDLEGYTNEVFCRVTNTSVGKATLMTGHSERFAHMGLPAPFS